jgi:hypothetical protein
MIKDVHINNPKPLLKGIEFRVYVAHSQESFRDYGYFEAVVAGKVREMRSREVGDSVLYPVSAASTAAATNSGTKPETS